MTLNHTLLPLVKHWLTTNDSAVKAEVCPEGYKIADFPCIERCGGGTALIYRDSLTIKRADAGQKKTLLSLQSHNIRVIIIYRRLIL